MTTFRRLPFAVSLSRLSFLILAVSSLSAEIRAQSTVKVGYYDMAAGVGVVAEQEPPITAAGFTPVRLVNVTAADLAGIHVLFVQNPSNMAYGKEYLDGRPAIQNAVNAGMLLVIHDRLVGPATRQILPGGMTVLATRVNSANIEVSDPNTLVASGPGGTVTNANLDNGNYSNQGFVNLLSVPAGRKGLLHTGVIPNPNQAVTFSYPFGLGFVIYSSIPLDFYLKGTGNNPPRDNFKNIYAPNVLAYAVSLRPWSTTLTVTSSTGQYGGTTTLTATLKSGSTALAGRTIDFSLDGAGVGSAQTDSSGMATLTNVSLGSTPDSAIDVGTYADGSSASFAGAGLFTAASRTAALTVEKAPATIDVVGGTFVYDGAPHEATGSATGVFDEPLGTPAFTYTDANGVTSESAPVNVGTYVITATSTETDNYLSTTVGSSTTTITITPAALTVTAHNKNRLYGGTNPTFEGTIVGIRGQDNITASYATEATSSSPVGRSDIVPTILDPDGRLANYGNPTVVNGVLTIDPAPLTVKANSKSRPYGRPNPTFEGTIVGIQGQDNITASYATEATSSSPVGTYDIVPTPLAPDDRLGNYTVVIDPGTLTIVKAQPVLVFTTAVNTSPLTGAASLAPVSATLVEEAGGRALAGQVVTFTQGATSLAAHTDGTGLATAQFALGVGEYSIAAAFAGDANYLPAAASGAQVLYVYQPTQFVIWGGNAPALDAAVSAGQRYMFWGAQWAKQVTAGSYNANSSFKGYASQAAGAVWTTTGGASSNPPAVIAQYVGVIVATRAWKTGSETAGNIAEVVVLRVDNVQGYAPNPGYGATGVMVAKRP